jgi:GNAT superfamily N-acetyltransferase
MEIRALTRADAEAFRRLRREGLEDAPRAFAESISEHDAQKSEAIAKRLHATGDHFVVGAFYQGALVGVAGFARNPRLKLRHKGMIWGVYVTSTFRGQGVARKLLMEIIGRAKSLDGLHQINLNVAAASPANRLYRSLGFQVFGQERNSIQVGDEFVDEELMVLRLK